MIWLLAACAHTLPTATIDVAGTPMVVEVAATYADREKGLMDRDKLDSDKGMLFVYPSESPREFWMKDTRIPLSIAYADRDGVVVHTADMKAWSTDRVPSLYPAQYALEVNQGWLAAHHVDKGSKLGKLPDVKAE